MGSQAFDREHRDCWAVHRPARKRGRTGGDGDGFSIGGIISTGYKEVTFDGLQATPGIGVVAIGDYVLTGTVVAKGTALTAALKVTKATSQAPGAYKARVVSLGQAGTGAVGTVGTVELF